MAPSLGITWTTRAGSVIIINAKPIPKYLGLITLIPSASPPALIIDEPTKLVITYIPNYVSLILMILAALVIALITMARHLGGGNNGGPLREEATPSETFPISFITQNR